jgi:mannose/cellobiose epimerase-like protein (N-acyl-D-glucosamine 2-epimerase family)
MTDRHSPIFPFFSRKQLRDEFARLMGFHHPRCLDRSGGYYQTFRQDGSVFEPQRKHLVGSTRGIVNYAFAVQEFGDATWRDAIRHGLAFLRTAHRNPASGGYAWLLDNGAVVDATNHCYGVAFVLLAYSKAWEAGVEEAQPWIDETFQLLEQHFWEPAYGLYADEATADWQVSGYRGQNPNMHLCEALLAAYEATHETAYLQRAELLADHMVNRQAALCHGQVWEHYDSSWCIDWEYNKGDRSNIFRPWGLQPGHQFEWAKLLLQLDQHSPQAWHLQRARELFDAAAPSAWDSEHQGFIYGYDPAGAPYDCDKYGWVQAEAMAAAALLRRATGDASYRDWYERAAHYAWQHFVDQRTACWYRIRKPDNASLDEIGCFSGLSDYHSIGTYAQLLRLLPE